MIKHKGILSFVLILGEYSMIGKSIMSKSEFREFVGIFALLGNVTVFITTSRVLNDTKNKTKSGEKLNAALILNLSIADLLVAVSDLLHLYYMENF